jgi:hypothetical protein
MVYYYNFCEFPIESLYILNLTACLCLNYAVLIRCGVSSFRVDVPELKEMHCCKLNELYVLVFISPIYQMKDYWESH